MIDNGDIRKGCITTLPGYLTVYLSLMLTLILSLLLTLIEGAKISAMRMQSELAAETSMESALSEFNRELLNRYDLLFVDTSYGTTDYGETQLREHLSECAEKNLSRGGLLIGDSKTFSPVELTSVSVIGTRYAADNNSEALREQISAYMGADPLENTVDSVLATIDQWQGLGIDTDAWKRKQEEIMSNAEEAFSTSHERFEERRRKAREAALESDDSSELEEVENEEQEAESDANTGFVNTLRNIRNDLVLSAVIEDTSDISDASIDVENFLSHQSIHTGTSLAVENTHHYSQADQIIFDEYLVEKCGSYRNNKVGGENLDYELEYILYGESSDRDNLTRIAETLLLVREVLNTAYIFSDSGKCAEAETIAAAVCTLLLIPDFTDAVKSLILIVWAMAESASDVTILLHGGKVPILKDRSDWHTSISGILNFGKASESGGKGLDYAGYLRIFLFLENASQKNGRLMDVMEMNIRKTDGNEHFRMDYCLDSFSARFEVMSSIGYNTAVTKEISYN